LTYRIEGDSIIIKASRYAKSVEIGCTNGASLYGKV